MEAAAVQAARREGPTMEAEGRARAERTSNMDTMLVTLDVSKLSGWLNAYVLCRGKGGKHRRRGHMRASMREGGVVVGGASSREALTVEAEGRARVECTENIHCMSVTLEMSKLSGWLNADA